MSRRGKLVWGVLVAAVVVLGVAVNVGANDAQAPLPNGLQADNDRLRAAMDKVRQGQGRAIAPAEVHWMLVWRNCRFFYIQENVVLTEVPSLGSPSNKMTLNNVTTTKDDILAQLPPVDPACLDVAPAQEALDAAQEELDRRNSVGKPPPPKVHTPATKPSQAPPAP